MCKQRSLDPASRLVHHLFYIFFSDATTRDNENWLDSKVIPRMIDQGLESKWRSCSITFADGRSIVLVRATYGVSSLSKQCLDKVTSCLWSRGDYRYFQSRGSSSARVIRIAGSTPEFRLWMLEIWRQNALFNIEYFNEARLFIFRCI